MGVTSLFAKDVVFYKNSSNGIFIGGEAFGED